jgi:hypothetical protein
VTNCERLRDLLSPPKIQKELIKANSALKPVSRNIEKESHTNVVVRKEFGASCKLAPVYQHLLNIAFLLQNA